MKNPLPKNSFYLIVLLVTVAFLGIFFVIPFLKQRNFVRYLDTLQQNEGLHGAIISVAAKYEGERDFLVSYNAHAKIHPGSNYKLFTAAASLRKLGPDFTFSTKLFLRKNSLWKTDLVLVGGGDPSLRLNHFESFVKAVKASGKISGDILYDDRYFIGEKFGPGWEEAWKKDYFAVPITGLQIHDNLLDIRGRKDEKTEKFTIITAPITNYPIKDEMVYFDNPNDLRKPITAEMNDDGEITLHGDTLQELSFWTSATVKDPSFMTVAAFKQSLEEAELIRKDARLIPFTEEDPGTLLFEHRSSPLHDIVFNMLKFSKNNYGETLVRTLGKVIKSEGSQEKGVLVLKDFFEEIGISTNEIDAFDGSGLSPWTRVTSAAILSLFEYVDEQPWGDLFWKSLPESQKDGTLKYRFENVGLKHTVLGKTGTHEFSSSLSGKILRPKQNILFSVHIFNHPFSTEESILHVIPLIDRIVVLLDKQF